MRRWIDNHDHIVHLDRREHLHTNDDDSVDDNSVADSDESFDCCDGCCTTTSVKTSEHATTVTVATIAARTSTQTSSFLKSAGQIGSVPTRFLSLGLLAVSAAASRM